MRYFCSKCSLAVIVLPNKEPIKACSCTVDKEKTIIKSVLFGLIKYKKKIKYKEPAPIFANMSAQSKGTSNVNVRI